jgi:type I restriction enzyme M protein
MNSVTIVQELWKTCNVLRDDGRSYADYVEQFTCRFFLKTADECSLPPYKQPSLIPKPYAWPALRAIAYHIRKRISHITHSKSIGCNHNG